MRIEVECRKRVYEPTAYGLKYKSYGDSNESIVVHLRRSDVKSKAIPDNFKVLIEWDDEVSS